MNWLDTQTKALLQRSPLEKLAPPDTATFSLMLLSIEGSDYDALVGAVQQVAKLSEHRAKHLLCSRPPVRVQSGLTYLDGQIGQFELICCDAVSVIIADEVVANAPPDYLADLYAKLRKIDEFELVTVRIDSLPDSPKGREFYDRFLGGHMLTPFQVTSLMRKKARIMRHWAAKIGGCITIVSEQAKPQ